MDPAGGLLEREQEMAAVRCLLDDAATSGGLLIVEGDAGIGKTAIIHEAVRLAVERGYQIGTARGTELEQELPFGTIRELLARAGVAREGLAGATALALPALMTPGSLTCGDGAALFPVLHGLYWATVAAVANRPTLLAVDDAHWCDLPSLRFVAYLAHRLDGLRIGILVTARPVAIGMLQKVLLSLAAESSATVVRPQPLGRTAVRSLAAAAMGSDAEDAFGDACRAVTGGNPFLLRELLAELRAVGTHPRAEEINRVVQLVPTRVRDVVSARPARLSSDSAALARASAVLGDGADPHRAARLAGLAPEDATAAVDELVAARLLESRLPLTFLHPLLRSAVESVTGPAESAATHRRAATMLADDGEDDDAVVPHLLAGQAVGDQWVVEHLRAAARRAAARGAPELASRYLRRALDEPPLRRVRPAVLLELGVAGMHAGLPDAHRHLKAAAEQAVGVTDRARASLALARALFLAGRVAEAVGVCVAAVHTLGDGHPQLCLELEVELVGAARQDISHRRLALQVLARRADPEPESTPECMMLANLAVEEAAALRSRKRTVALADRAFHDGWLFEPKALVTLPLALYALTLAGRAGHSLQRCDEAIAHYQNRGEVQGYALVLAFRSYIALALGDVEAAVTDAQTTLDLCRAHDIRFIAGHTVAWLVEALIEVGALDVADREIAGQAALITDGAQFVGNRLLSARGQLRLAQGRLDEAVADLRACEHRLAAWETRNPWLCPWIGHLALALLAKGDRAEARKVAAEAVRLARDWGVPSMLAESLRVAGLTAGGADGEALLRRAVDVAATGESPLEQARALAALGGALRRAGRRREARGPLREALDRAMRCGAPAVARRAHEELVASGAQPRRLRTTGTAALTHAERRVATMAAAGQTNRTLAQALFVSEKTIETHLGNAYRKLGIRARSQLADALARAKQ